VGPARPTRRRRTHASSGRPAPHPCQRCRGGRALALFLREISQVRGDLAGPCLTECVLLRPAENAAGSSDLLFLRTVECSGAPRKGRGSHLRRRTGSAGPREAVGRRRVARPAGESLLLTADLWSYLHADYPNALSDLEVTTVSPAFARGTTQSLSRVSTPPKTRSVSCSKDFRVSYYEWTQNKRSERWENAEVAARLEAVLTWSYREVRNIATTLG
jgi:hypothetical protein